MSVDTYELWQLTQEPEGRYRFERYSDVRELLRAKDYTKTWEGTLPEVDLAQGNLLEYLFRKHNPAGGGCGARSAAVSDIFVIWRAGHGSAYYVDPIGFVKLDWRGNRGEN